MSITLTSPPAVKSVLGGAGTVAYDKFVLASITYDTVEMSVMATIRITSTASPDMQPIMGRLYVTLANAKLEIQVDQLDYYRRLTLTGPQSTSLQNQIRAAQDSLETGLINIALIAGTQATGS
jgi:hypothetical protein